MSSTTTDSIVSLVVRSLVERAGAAAATPALDPVYVAETNAPKLLAIAGTFITLGTICVSLRMYCRMFLIKCPGWDDYCMCVALMFAWVDFGCFVGKKQYGMGRHSDTISPDVRKGYTHIGYFQSQAFVMTTCFIKVSIALLLMRLTPHVWWRRFLWGMIIFIACFSTACMGTLIFQCWPVNAAWDPVAKLTGYCYPRKTFASIGLFNTSINITTDVIFASVPIPIVWNLQMNRNTKLAVVGILSLGYFATIAGIIKGVKQINWIKLKDTTFNEEIHTWDAIAIGIAIAAACAPTLKPLFRTILGLGSSRGESHGVSNGYRRRSEYEQYGSSTKKSVNNNVSFLSKYHGKGFEMDTQIMRTKMDSEEELAAQYAATVSPGGTIRKAPSGEDIEMGERREQKMGVTRTVEVTVTSTNRDRDSL